MDTVCVCVCACACMYVCVIKSNDVVGEGERVIAPTTVSKF